MLGVCGFFVPCTYKLCDIPFKSRCFILKWSQLESIQNNHRPLVYMDLVLANFKLTVEKNFTKQNIFVYIDFNSYLQIINYLTFRFEKLINNFFIDFFCNNAIVTITN